MFSQVRPSRYNCAINWYKLLLTKRVKNAFCLTIAFVLLFYPQLSARGATISFEDLTARLVFFLRHCQLVSRLRMGLWIGRRNWWSRWPHVCGRFNRLGFSNNVKPGAGSCSFRNKRNILRLELERPKKLMDRFQDPNDFQLRGLCDPESRLGC